MSELELTYEALKRTANREHTAEQAAKAAYEALKELLPQLGLKPEFELFIKAPGERSEPGPSNWWVCWESGPYNWGTSLTLSDIWPGLVETYWGFDLIFCPGDWPV